jgi:hypothetical protein
MSETHEFDKEWDEECWKWCHTVEGSVVASQDPREVWPVSYECEGRSVEHVGIARSPRRCHSLSLQTHVDPVRFPGGRGGRLLVVWQHGVVPGSGERVELRHRRDLAPARAECEMGCGCGCTTRGG